MKRRILEILKQKNSKLIAVDHETAEKIEKMTRDLATTPEDVICSALTLLELSLGKEVVLVDNKNNQETKIKSLESLTENHD